MISDPACQVDRPVPGQAGQAGQLIVLCPLIKLSSSDVTTSCLLSRATHSNDKPHCFKTLFGILKNFINKLVCKILV